MSRTALDGFPLGVIKRGFMLDLIRRYAALYLVEVLRFFLMIILRVMIQFKGLLAAILSCMNLTS